tara:strand:+ start:12965 stop:13933 length:969 start_codon:yes stop_codon:yes gene_type:complete
MKSIFFFKKKRVTLKKLFPKNKILNDFNIENVRSLAQAQKKDISFFDKSNYSSEAQITKAGACITTENLKKYLNKKTYVIIVNNVLYELARVLGMIYSSADIDYPDLTLKKPTIKKYKTVKFGNNVLIGKNVQIGKNSIIGSNSIIEHDVKIGDNCVIGSGVIIKNSIIGDRVVFQDNCKIGLKGFGFIPQKNKNIKFPHVGRVLIYDDVEIGSGCTIDRGSIDDTIIGSNTYLDNQVHIAHNVKIGANCMIAGQVGFAGSTVIGDKVSIGGQAGISGHLKIGKNVKIGGGSGVVKDIDDNQIVMGYPAIPLKNFIKNNKNK